MPAESGLAACAETPTKPIKIPTARYINCDFKVLLLDAEPPCSAQVTLKRRSRGTFASNREQFDNGVCSALSRARFTQPRHELSKLSPDRLSLRGKLQQVERRICNFFTRGVVLNQFRK